MEEGLFVRVNGEKLAANGGNTVSIVGELEGTSEGGFTLKSTDNREIKVLFGGSVQKESDPCWIEVIGVAESADTVRAEKVIPLSKTIQPDIWNEVTDLPRLFPEIFAV
mgnify:CR=1 FL=1